MVTALSTKKRLPVKNKYSDDFIRIYATGVLGGFSAYDFRFSFFNDSLKQSEDPAASPTAVREIQGEVVMTHLAAKQFRDWLNRKIDDLDKYIAEFKKLSKDEAGESSANDPDIYG